MYIARVNNMHHAEGGHSPLQYTAVLGTVTDLYILKRAVSCQSGYQGGLLGSTLYSRTPHYRNAINCRLK